MADAIYFGVSNQLLLKVKRAPYPIRLLVAKIQEAGVKSFFVYVCHCLSTCSMEVGSWDVLVLGCMMIKLLIH